MDQKQDSLIQRIKGIKKERLIHGLIVTAVIFAVIGLVVILIGNNISVGGLF